MFSVTGQYNLWNTNEGDMKELVYINPVTTSIQVAGRCDTLDLDLAGFLLFAINLQPFVMSSILYSLSVFLHNLNRMDTLDYQIAHLDKQY